MLKLDRFKMEKGFFATYKQDRQGVREKMMKLQITTFVLVGGLIGLFTDGVMVGVGAAALVFIAYKIEKFIEEKAKD
ncbi:hypothetical protein C1N55_10575 [Lysinibacillus sp. SGAir0095]|nr:hypothetical protein C1N55_10575 [Lysinibacillus sp. SGAir0095]